MCSAHTCLPLPPRRVGLTNSVVEWKRDRQAVKYRFIVAETDLEHLIALWQSLSQSKDELRRPLVRDPWRLRGVYADGRHPRATGWKHEVISFLAIESQPPGIQSACKRSRKIIFWILNPRNETGDRWNLEQKPRNVRLTRSEEFTNSKGDKDLLSLPLYLRWRYL